MKLPFTVAALVLGLIGMAAAAPEMMSIREGTPYPLQICFQHVTDSDGGFYPYVAGTCTEYHTDCTSSPHPDYCSDQYGNPVGDINVSYVVEYYPLCIGYPCIPRSCGWQVVHCSGQDTCWHGRCGQFY